MVFATEDIYETCLAFYDQNRIQSFLDTFITRLSLREIAEVLNFAFGKDDNIVFDAFFNSISDINVVDGSGFTILMHLAEIHASMEIIDIFLNEVPNLSLSTSLGENILHIAAANGNFPLVERIITEN